MGGIVEHVGQPHSFDPWHVIANDGRVWKVVADASLGADRSVQAEVVSPILKAADMETLQEVVRAVRKAGATVDATCGIHVHLGAQAFNAKAVTNLVRIVHKHERHIEHALGVAPQRLARWCKPIDAAFLQRLETQKPTTLEALNKAWYGHYNNNPQHYDPTRYRGLNLHNIWYRGTIEFRCFEATLHERVGVGDGGAGGSTDRSAEGRWRCRRGRGVAVHKSARWCRRMALRGLTVQVAKGVGELANGLAQAKTAVLVRRRVGGHRFRDSHYRLRVVR